MRPRSLRPVYAVVIIAVLSIITLLSLQVGFAANQLFFFLVSALGYWLVSSLPYTLIRRWRWLVYLGSVGLLLMLFVFGVTVKGSLNWLTLGSSRLQPSEFMKPILIMILSTVVAQHTDFWQRPRRWWLAGLAVAAPLLLVLSQQDLGTVLVMITGVGTVFLFSRPPRWVVVTTMVLSLVLMTGGWFVLKPYQRNRLLNFVAPQRDPQGSGYNARQAVIAVGAGGLTGQGWGQGSQSHLRFLPERQTDFLFASYAEETGFLGSTTLIAMYAALYWTLIRQVRELNSPEKTFITAGILAMLMAQTVENIGMNIGIMPITGVTLPFFSLGGSSFLASALSLGLLESMRRSSLLPHARVY
jgi:rod shape determining protein RodA